MALSKLSVATFPTPGHTPGGRSFLIEGQLFTGDKLFRSNVGRTDLYGRNAAALAVSVKTLLDLPADISIHPGHGQPSTLGDDRRDNVVAQALIDAHSG